MKSEKLVQSIAWNLECVGVGLPARYEFPDGNFRLGPLEREWQCFCYRSSGEWGRKVLLRFPNFTLRINDAICMVIEESLRR